MRKRYCNEGLTWLLQDIRDMKDISDGSIDVAIDKVSHRPRQYSNCAGQTDSPAKATLDAMCHGSVFDPPDEVIENVKKYMDEVRDVFSGNRTRLRKTRWHASSRHEVHSYT